MYPEVLRTGAGGDYFSLRAGCGTVNFEHRGIRPPASTVQRAIAAAGVKSGIGKRVTANRLRTFEVRLR